MPIDRTNNNTSRPLKPTLATTRTAKTPVTPRLAPSIASASSTPAARTPRLAVGTTPRLNSGPQEDVTPAKGYPHSNVTPRSSSRKVRVGVNSTGSTPSVTPSGTPIHPRPASTVDYPQTGGLGVQEAGVGPNKRPRSVVGGNNFATSTPRLPLSGIYSHASDAGTARGASVSPRFFHANDARASEPQPQPQPQPPPIKKAVFFHANGDLDASSRSPSAPPMHAESKFFHANSPPTSRDSPPILSAPSNSISPEPTVSFQTSDGSQSLQQPSPTKENIHLSYRKGASQVIRPNMHRGQSALSILSGSHVSEDSNDGPKKQSSPASSTPRYSHTKSASLSSIESAHSLKKIMSHDTPHVAPSPLHNENRVGSHNNSSFSDSVASASSDIPALSNLPSPGPLSPNIPAPGQSMLEKMNELAANARRERKVLDLEISNNSLLAINRSLEKEVRKQKAEIRRFRRMSRAGQFSANTISHMEAFSAIGASDLGNLTDMSEEEEQEEEESEEPEPEELSDSSFDESIMSDSALAERDQAHRLRDEKRLKLDLAKHQELIVDSQKMNQSLARCLGWTEELIKNGRKALAYQVRASDVQLGGRVLISDDQLHDEHDEEHHGDSRGLLSPWSPPHRAMNPMDPDSPPLAADRDSGIDIDGTKFQGFISPLASPL